MHPPVTDVGVRLLALSHAVTLRTRDCCPALSLPLSVFAAALGLRVATVFTLCVYSIVVIVFTPLCSVTLFQYSWERKRAVSLG